MDTLQAVSIIDKVRDQNGLGLLEMLEVMTDEHEASGTEYFEHIYTTEEREAYFLLMDGFREFFHGRG